MLSTIDRLVQKMGFVNALVDRLVSKIAPSTSAVAACPQGWYTSQDAYTWECWASTSCGSNKCVRVKTRTFFYHFIPYACQQVISKVCNSTTCVGPSNC